MMGKMLASLLLAVLSALLLLWALSRRSKKHLAQGDVIVISGATGGVGSALRRLYPGQTIVTLSRSPVENDPYNLVIDYSDFSAFSERFSTFLAEKRISADRIREYHSLHGFGVLAKFSELDPRYVENFIQVNVFSHVYLINYFIKLRSLQRVTMVSSLAHHAPTAEFQLYQASKAFIEQLSTGIILERPDLDVVCAVPCAIRGTRFVDQPGMRAAGKRFRRMFSSVFSVSSEYVAGILCNRKSGVYRAGVVVFLADIVKTAIGVNLWARLLTYIRMRE